MSTHILDLQKLEENPAQDNTQDLKMPDAITGSPNPDGRKDTGSEAELKHEHEVDGSDEAESKSLRPYKKPRLGGANSQDSADDTAALPPSTALPDLLPDRPATGRRLTRAENLDLARGDDATAGPMGSGEDIDEAEIDQFLSDCPDFFHAVASVFHLAVPYAKGIGPQDKTLRGSRKMEVYKEQGWYNS